MSAIYRQRTEALMGVGRGGSDDPYLYAARLIKAPSHFAVISSNDSIETFDLGDDGGMKSSGCRHSGHAGITCLEACPTATTASGSVAYLTAGRDGRIQAWSWPEYQPVWEVTTPDAKPISALAVAQTAQGLVVAAGTEHQGEGLGEVGVFVWTLAGDDDGKTPPALKLAYTESHSDTVTTLHFDLSLPDTPRLLSASTDGLVHLFDLGIADEDDAVVVTFNNQSAVHHACLLSNGMVCAVSHDEQLAFYSLDDESESNETETGPPATHDLRRLLECDYAISLRPTPDGSSVVVAVGANKPETTAQPWLGLCALKVGPELLGPGASLETRLLAKLEHGHGDDVVRDMHYTLTPEAGLGGLLTCGEDGRARTWALDTAETRPPTSTSKRDKDDKPRRFKPY